MKFFKNRPIFVNEDSGWGRSGGQSPSESGPDNTPNKPDNNQQSPRNNPPDLEELWQGFNRRLSRLLSGRANGGHNGRDRNPKNDSPNLGSAPVGAGLGGGAILFLLVWLGSGFFIVQEGQVGVVLQFGKYSATASPGFQWRPPYPIASHEIVNLSQIRTVEVGYRNNVKTKVLSESLMLTDDENIIDLQFAVQYKLKDASAYLFNNRSPEDNVLQAAETAIREVVGRSKMDFVLYEGREQVGIDVASTIQKILDRYQTGILVSSVSVQNAQPPEQVQAAFDDAVKAAQDRERLKSEGEAYANEVVPKAKGAAARLVEEANGYKQRVILQAEGDAARFRSVLAEYSKAPAVTRDRLYIETMQQVLSNVTKVMTDSKQSNQLLYLPLDKLLNQTTQGSDLPAKLANTPTINQGGGVAAPAVVDSLVPVENLKGRPSDNRNDNLRNRDRGGR